MSPKRRKLLLALLACGLLALVAFIVFRESEPSYKGKSLSTWLIQMNDESPNENQRRAARSEAADAIQAIGTNTLPYLLKWISSAGSPPSGARRITFWAMQKIPALKRIEGLQVWTLMEMGRRSGAPDAFKALGDRAIPAIPELSNLANTSTNRGASFVAAQALAKIGPSASPALAGVITNQHSLNREVVIMSIALVRPPVSAAVPPFIRCLTDGHPAIVQQAVIALGEMDQPALVVPALTNLFSSLQRSPTSPNFDANSDYDLVVSISRSLAKFRLEARDAAPALIQYLANRPTLDARDFSIMQSILQITDSPQITVPLLTRYLSDTNASLSQWSARKLAGIGPPAAPALPALTNALQNSTGNIHETISIAIREIISPTPGFQADFE